VAATKVCKECGDEKPLEAFAIGRGNKGGRRPRCKACVTQWRREHPEHMSAEWRRHYEKHGDRVRARANAYYQDNSEAVRASVAAYRAEHLDEIREKQRFHHAANKDRAKAYTAASRARLKAEVIAAYGGACACCGECRPQFLAIDHIYGDGKQDRRGRGIGSQFYAWLRASGFPRDRYQLLCHNCNFAKGHRGECPHRSEPRDAGLSAGLLF